MVSSLVSCAWLKEQLNENRQDIRVLDGTWHQLHLKRDANQEYLDQHIEGAVRFDIAEVRDKSNPLPFMLPPARQFEEQVGKMGISNDTHVVIYDNNAKVGFYSAGRVWWIFRVFGHHKVSILDGGLPKWIAEGHPTVSGPPGEVSFGSFKATYTPSLVHNLEQMTDILSSKSKQVFGHHKVSILDGGLPKWIAEGHPTVSGPPGEVSFGSFKATYTPSLVHNLEQMTDILSSKSKQWVDTRPKGRYDGTAPEPNTKIHSGHVLGTTNIPFYDMVDPQSKTLKDKSGLQKEFEKAGIDLSKPLVVSCASAIVAGLVAFSVHLLGKEVPVYDGSWTDWVQNAPEATMHLGVKGKDLNN